MGNGVIVGPLYMGATGDGRETLTVDVVVVICDEVEASCRCVLPVGHDGLHECATYCGGSWGRDAEGKFVIGRWPGSA